MFGSPNFHQPEFVFLKKQKIDNFYSPQGIFDLVYWVKSKNAKCAFSNFGEDLDYTKKTISFFLEKIASFSPGGIFGLVQQVKTKNSQCVFSRFGKDLDFVEKHVSKKE